MGKDGNNPSNRVGLFHVLCLAGFATLTLVVTTHHEMWIDELSHWSIALKSRSFADIFKNLEYESSPPLWHMILYGITRVTGDPVAMQTVHVLLAVIAMGIFLVWSPFSRLQKALFVFGYFPAFEYCVISRHYVLGELLLFGFLALFPWHGKRRFAAAIVLFLLAQTSLFGLIMALACAGAMMARHLMSQPSGLEAHRQLIVPLVFVGVGCIWSAIQIIPPPDSSLHPAWDFINPWHALQAGTTTWRSFFPIPLFQVEFWNTNVLDSSSSGFLRDLRSIPSLLLQDILSAGILLGSLIYFRRRPDAFVLFVIVTMSCLIFFYLKKLGFLRHHGHLYLAWIAALWVSWSPSTSKPPSRTNVALQGNRQIGIRQLVTFVLVAHVVAAVYASVMEYRFTFSAAGEVAQWIRAQGLEEDLLIGDQFSTSAVAALLERDLFQVEDESLHRFTVWRRRSPLSSRELVEITERMARAHDGRVLLVLKKMIPESDTARKVKKVAEFTETILPYERYYLYSPAK